MDELNKLVSPDPIMDRQCIQPGERLELVGAAARQAEVPVPIQFGDVLVCDEKGNPLGDKPAGQANPPSQVKPVEPAKVAPQPSGRPELVHATVTGETGQTFIVSTTSGPSSVPKSKLQEVAAGLPANAKPEDVAIAVQEVEEKSVDRAYVHDGKKCRLYVEKTMHPQLHRAKKAWAVLLGAWVLSMLVCVALRLIFDV